MQLQAWAGSLQAGQGLRPTQRPAARCRDILLLNNCCLLLQFAAALLIHHRNTRFADSFK